MLNSSDRKTFRYIAGDFTFDDYRARWREPLYLERNLTRVLEHHQQRLIAEAPRSESRKEGPVTAAGIADNPASTSQVSHRAVGDIRSTTTSSLPISESVVQAILPPTGIAPHLMASSEPGETGQQRTKSLRSLRGRNSTTDSQSNLHIDLNNIRKKLNFKTNLLDEGERSSKRQKRDAIKCKCHLTIWDSSTNAPPSIPKAFTKDCLVTATETAAHGCFVNIEMESPFVIRNEDLMFTRDTKEGLITSLVDKYFMEIKIIPCRVNSQWPPIPLLGKSDGDNFAHDVKADFGELQGAVVARYMHLPQAPDADVPLSIFFLHGGRTYRTKYGLSVSSKWTSAFSTSQPTNGIDLDSFREPTLLPPTPSTNPRGVVDRRTQAGTKNPSTKTTIIAPTTPKVPATPDVHYRFIATSSTGFGESEALRRSVVKGYICPICTMWKSTKLVNLEFHLATTHAKYKWTVHNARQDLTRKTSKPILIECRLLPPPKKEERKDNIFAFEWHAPNKAFDLPAFLGGDEKWLIDKKPQLPSIRKTVNHKKVVTPLLPASQVPDFREPQRKKYAAVNRLVPHKADKSVYTSISHRPVSPSEEPRSETDDEIDNEWQIQQHLERLDIMAKKEGWSIHQRELRKRWDKHRMEEHLEHSTYLSNSLVRFVRKNRKWLSNGEGDLLETFFDHLQRLKERRFIDDNVVMDVNEIIFNSPTSRPSTANNTLLTNGFKSPGLRNGISSPVLSNGFSSPPHIDDHDRELERALRPNTLLTPQKSTASTMTNGTHDYSPTSTRLAKDACGICRIPIKNAIKNGTFCTDICCETARTMYHQKCVETNSARGISNGKGKAINLQSWICMVCSKRRHTSDLVAKEGHEEKGSESTSTKEPEIGREEVIKASFEVDQSPQRPSGRVLNASMDRNGGRFARLS